MRYPIANVGKNDYREGVLKSMTIRCPEEIQRRFVAWAKLNGLSAQQVLVDFMKERGERLAGLEDPKTHKK